MSSETRKGWMSRWPRRIARRTARWVEHGLAAIGLVALVYLLCFNLSFMSSGSMSPTLQGTGADDGDWVLTERVSYWFRKPRRWEIVTFHSEDGLQVMKRVAGLPGETVSIQDKVLCVNGQPAEPRPQSLNGITYLPFGRLIAGRPSECGNGYFVLGDDSLDSYDSRYTAPVERKKIVGRAWLIAWPPSRIRFLNP